MYVPLILLRIECCCLLGNQTPLLENWSAKEKKNPIDVFFSHDRYQKKIVNKLPNDGNGQTSLLILFS